MQSLINPCKAHHFQPLTLLDAPRISRQLIPGFHSFPATNRASSKVARKLVVTGCQEKEKQQEEEEKTAKSGGDRRTFLSLEEAGLVELSGLSTHERFLCRLTISSLNLLRVISEQEGVPIEELNAGRICDWFLKDKLKRERNIESAVLQWDDPGF